MTTASELEQSARNENVLELSRLCEAFCAGFGEGISLREEFTTAAEGGVHVVVRRQDTRDLGGPVQASLYAGRQPRSSAVLPHGWTAPSRAGTAASHAKREVIDELLGHAQEAQAEGEVRSGDLIAEAVLPDCRDLSPEHLKDVLWAALQWEPAPHPVFLQIEAITGPSTPLKDRRRVDKAREAARERSRTYRDAVWQEAGESIHRLRAEASDRRQRTWKKGPIDDHLTAAVDEAAYTALFPSHAEALAGALAEWAGGTQELLELAAAVQFEPTVYPLQFTIGEDAPEEPGAFQLAEWCERAFARAWFSGQRPLAATLLKEVVRLEGERSATGNRAAEALFNLSLLQRDLDEALRAGDAVLCGTGYDSLAHLARSRISLLEKEDPGFAAQLSAVARTMTPRPWEDLPHERDDWDDDEWIGAAASEVVLDPVTSPALRWPLSASAEKARSALAQELVELVGALGDISVILGDSDNGGWLQIAIESEQVGLAAALPAGAASSVFLAKLADAGLALDAARGQAEMICAASNEEGSEEDLLREVVTVSLALLEHAYGFAAAEDLRWVY